MSTINHPWGLLPEGRNEKQTEAISRYEFNENQ